MQTAATSLKSSSSRLFIYDKCLRILFLIDTGSDISILPHSFASYGNFNRVHNPNLSLTAANGTPIKTHGELETSINLKFPRKFRWNFTVAEVNQAIIGADFLAAFGLLVDIKKARLIEASTLVSSHGIVRTSSFPEIHVIYHYRHPKIQSILAEFPTLAQPPNFKAPRCHNIEHSIPTMGPAVTSKPRRLRPDLANRAKGDVQDMVRLGIMRPSTSNWSSPVVIKEKPDKTLRICGDYRSLNSITTKDEYPMPLLADSTARLAEKSVFSSIDIVRAYYNIPVAAEDQKKTALTFPFGLYEHITMPFGLTNAPKTWQRFIDNLFRDIDYVFVYLDDILIFSKSEEEHERHLRTVLQRLADTDLHINAAKCSFFQTSVQFLGHEVSASGIAPMAKKLEAIENLPYPKTIHDLRRQLGLLNFYRPFMRNAATILAPLCDLLKGHTKRRDRTPIVWTDELRTAHRLAKSSLVNYVRLVHPRANAPLRLTTDASDIAAGGVLEQADQDGEYEPIGFFSEKFTETQQRWTPFDRELHAIALGIEKFEHLLEGRDFVVRTDHKPLVPLKPGTGKKRALDRRNRAIEYVLQFNPTIQHISGTENVVADCLSRPETCATSQIVTPVTYAEIAAAQAADLETIYLLNNGFRRHDI